MSENFEPINQHCKEFMSREGFKRLELLARGRGPARKRPDLTIQALRLISEYAFGRPPKQAELRDIQKREKFGFL